MLASLILQPYFITSRTPVPIGWELEAPATIVTEASLSALAATPIRPTQTQLRRVRWQGQSNFQQVSHFRNRQFCKLWVDRPFLFVLRRRAASQVCAIIESVICRCQLCQERTSY